MRLNILFENVINDFNMLNNFSFGKRCILALLPTLTITFLNHFILKCLFHSDTLFLREYVLFASNFKTTHVKVLEKR